MSEVIQDDTDRLFRSIGEVVVQFQFVENTLSELLASLLQLNDQDDCHRVAAAMSFKQKVDLMCDVYVLRKPSDWRAVDITLVRKALNAAEDFRNRVVHSFWHIGGKDSEWQSTKVNLRSKHGLRVTTGAANITSLELGARAICEVRDWYLGDTDKLRGATDELVRVAATLCATVNAPDES